MTAIGQRLPSEASLRFGRGVPAAGCPDAARRAAELMRRHAGGAVARGRRRRLPAPAAGSARCGCPAGRDRARARLRRPRGGGAAHPRLPRLHGDRRTGPASRSAPPPTRLDLAIPADLVEEVARITGYHRIPSAPMSGEFAPPRPNPAMDGRGPRARRARRLRPDRGDHLLADRPGLVHAPRPRGGRQRLRLPRQPDDRRPHAPAPPHPAGAARDAALQPALRRPRRDLRAGARLPPRRSSSSPRSRGGWRCCSAARRRCRGGASQAPPPYDFFHAKGILETLAERLNVGPLSFAPYEGSPYQRGRAAVVSRGGETRRDLRRARPGAAPRLRPAGAARGARRVRRRGAAGRRGARRLPQPLALPGADAGPRDRLPGGAAGGAGRGRRCARPRATCSPRCGSSTSTAATRCRRGRGAWRSRWRSRRRTARWRRTTSLPVRARIIAALKEKLGVDLRA